MNTQELDRQLQSVSGQVANKREPGRNALSVLLRGISKGASRRNIQRHLDVLLMVGTSFFAVLALYFFVGGWAGLTLSMGDFVGGWPFNILSLFITLGIIWYVDSVKTEISKIEENMQLPMYSFDEVRNAAFRLLKEATENKDAHELSETRFWMTSATPVFGLESDEKTELAWRKLLRRRQSEEDAETWLLCYDWHAPEGPERSALGKFAKVISPHLKGGKEDWRRAFVRAWDQYDELLPNVQKTGSKFWIQLIQEPEFGMVIAKRSAHEKEAIIYLSNSASVEQGRDAVAYRTRDKNWIELLELTFKSLAQDPAQSKRLTFKRESAVVLRDQELYAAFQGQKDEVLSQEIERDQRPPIKVAVYPGVFPVAESLDTKAMIDAIDIVFPELNKLVQQQRIKRADGSAIRSLRGIDVGAGTGALAMVMGEYCDDVTATDNYRPARRNTLFNLSKYAHERNDLRGLKAFRGPRVPEQRPDSDDDVDIDQLVVSCDLAKRIYRRSDHEMLAFCFNYPAYPSPSNVFNTGGERAGESIVREFLADISDRFEACDIVLLPRTGITDSKTQFTIDLEDIAKDHEFMWATFPPHIIKRNDYKVNARTYVLYRHEAEAWIEPVLKIIRAADRGQRGS